MILAPLAGLFVYALVTKDVMQSLLLGTFSMYILWHKFGAVNGFFADLMTSLSDERKILPCICPFFLCGGVIIALKKRKYQKLCEVYHIKFGKAKMILASSEGIYAGVMSIDDYVSALTAGASFSPLIDVIKKQDLHWLLSYEPLFCVSEMLPFGAWGYFVIFQIASAKMYMEEVRQQEFSYTRFRICLMRSLPVSLLFCLQSAFFPN